MPDVFDPREGLEQQLRLLRLRVQRSRKGARGMAKAMRRFAAELEQILNRRGTGRLYRRRGRVHQASRPGEPPAPDRHNLLHSVWWNVTPEGEGSVGVVHENPDGLEFGSRDGKVAPRPFMRPTLARVEQGLAKDLGDDLNLVVQDR